MNWLCGGDEAPERVLPQAPRSALSGPEWKHHRLDIIAASINFTIVVINSINFALAQRT